MTVARLPIHDSRRRPPGVARNRITPAHTSQVSRLFSSPNCASACPCCARVARLVRPPIEQSVSSGDLAGRRGSPRRPHEGFRGCRVGNTKGWSCQAEFGGALRTCAEGSSVAPDLVGPARPADQGSHEASVLNSSSVRTHQPDERNTRHDDNSPRTNRASNPDRVTSSSSVSTKLRPVPPSSRKHMPELIALP